MKTKITFIATILLFWVLTGCGGNAPPTDDPHTFAGHPVVYFTSDVSSEGLLAAYKRLEASSDKNIALKLSDTETDQDFTWSDLIGDLSRTLGSPTVVERDSETDLSAYDNTIILSHFRSHEEAGFNGAVKQAAIISFSPEESECPWSGQEGLELLVENGKRTVDALDGNLLYISVVDHLSIESGSESLPNTDTYNIGILSSYDPVALDQACIDLICMLKEGAPLAAHINSCDGIYALSYAEQIGLGSRTYALAIQET